MKRVLSVGQCGADHFGISRTLQLHFEAEVVAAHTPEEALSRLRQGDFALILVNRVLDSDGSSGLDLVKQLKVNDDLRELPVMLVSNYEDAQEEAIRAGAVPGFGKSALGQPRMLDRVRLFLK
jgi:two-component system chemotaxis response regulator CheY